MEAGPQEAGAGSGCPGTGAEGCLVSRTDDQLALGCPNVVVFLALHKGHEVPPGLPNDPGKLRGQRTRAVSRLTGAEQRDFEKASG